MRDVVFVGSSQVDLRGFPDRARRLSGFSLEWVQRGAKPENAKPLRGFGGAGVQEIVSDDEAGTCRLVYAVTLPDAVYVLHAFQKKSTQGIKKSQRDMDVIQRRLREAREISSRRTRAQGEVST